MSQSDQPAAAKPGAPILIPAGRTFTPDEITFFKDKGTRTLEQAIAEADLLVSCPHSGDAVPEELAEFLAPEFTQRLQFDYSDRTTGPVVRAWAQLDPRIIYVENPHSRLLRDPNRPRPANLGAQLREAFARVRDAGAWNKVDLTGVDTIRPVTFSFFPLLRVPDSDAELEAMVKAFESVAERGLGVYESTRNSIRNAMVAAASERVKNGGRAQVTTLSFHDTMNHTTTRDGAVNVLRAPADQLPDVVALSNRGDAQGNRRGEDVITMEPDALRALADCHRTGFDVAFDADVALNTPYLGSQEIIASGERFRNLTDSTFTLASGSGTVQLGAVQAEFLREYLLGPTATAALQLPGTGWPEEDTEWTATLGRHCMASWNEFRAWFASQEPEAEPA